jgi:hypothetical protein
MPTRRPIEVVVVISDHEGIAPIASNNDGLMFPGPHLVADGAPTRRRRPVLRLPREIASLTHAIRERVRQS